MTENELSDFVAVKAQEFGIPGVVVGIWVDGREVFACHGVTSVANPLPVTPDTLFSVGSISKTFTATTLMRLVADGKVQLDAPVREYVPELTLADEQTAQDMTVRNLLNHTAGLGVRLVVAGDGDDALALYVTAMAQLAIIAPVGARASYSQAGYNLLGRIVEKVTGRTFEQAVAETILGPAGLQDTTYSLNDVMVRRFAVGHNADEDETPVVARQWKDTRGNNPGGGIASTAADLLRWARVHLADGAAADGTAILPAETARQMRRPTVALRASSLGDAFGLGWFLRDVEGVAVAAHGGSGNGQFADLQIVPDRDFAVVATTNAGPGGVAFNQALVRWALEHFLGLVEKDPEPIPFDEARTAETVGVYDVDFMSLTVAAGKAGLTLEIAIKPEVRAASDVELPADYPPLAFGMLPGDGDEYIVTAGAMQGQRGYFTRDDSGAIIGIDLAGRLFTRVAKS
jgi:CubicO group peptidase (beta-lactamase class C family)